MSCDDFNSFLSCYTANESSNRRDFTGTIVTPRHRHTDRYRHRQTDTERYTDRHRQTD